MGECQAGLLVLVIDGYSSKFMGLVVFVMASGLLYGRRLVSGMHTVIL